MQLLGYLTQAAHSAVTRLLCDKSLHKLTLRVHFTICSSNKQ